MTAPAYRLDGKRALVTGGGTGIGLGIAEAFAASGARVALAGRRGDVVRHAAESIGAAAHAVTADVTSPADRERLLAETLARLGGLDILVNCAGAALSRPLAELDEAAWRRILDVNLVAPAELSRAALPALRERRGSILNVSTGAALHPVPGYAAYGSSKAALNYVSQVLAMEAAPEVRVNVICPGGVDTPIFATFLPEERIPAVLERFRERTPLGRVGRPADVAGAAVYLSSDAAEWVTGAVLTVDGGMNLG
jgi:NAD(P)-dependent dehydrogenase (short-subunit alcohol dehydrogenase family)